MNIIFNFVTEAFNYHFSVKKNCRIKNAEVRKLASRIAVLIFCEISIKNELSLLDSLLDTEKQKGNSTKYKELLSLKNTIGVLYA